MRVDPSVVADEVRYCEGCPLRDSEYVMGDGYTDCPVMVVGSAPGKTEELTGISFTGEHGRLVRSILESLGLEAYYTNVLKRRPKSEDGSSRKPTARECWKCGNHLVTEIVRNQPRVIVTLGSTATSFFFSKRYQHRLHQCHGLPLPLRKFALDLYVIPTFDPAYVQRNGGLNSAAGDSWISDLEDAVGFVRREGL